MTFTWKNSCLLKLYNPSKKPIELILEFISRDQDEELNVKANEKVKLVLANTTKKEYVLKLPSGSKPKLGPGSNTGMFFNLGDKIYFIYEGKELLLLEVDESFKNGDVININKMAKLQLGE